MRLEDPAATDVAGRQFAAAILSCHPEQLCVWLKGELGAGKTSLSRGLIQGLGHAGRVPSPTYTLIEPYSLDRYTVYHMDLYRLGEAQELDFLGVDEYWGAGSLLLVEWPERGGDFLPGADLVIGLSVAGNGRDLEIEARSPVGRQIAAAWLSP